MRGTISKKGNRWYAVIYDGINSDTGKPIRRWVAAGTRRTDAERVLADLVQRKYGGEPVVKEKLTVGDYLLFRWLPIQKTRLRETTYDSYARNIHLHVVSVLGRKRLVNLTVEDIDHFYAMLLTDGRKEQRDGANPGLSPKTVRNIHVMLNKAMVDAQRKGLVARNVVALADAPSSKADAHRRIKAWNANQLGTFLETISQHRLHPAYHLSSHTGMRRGELLGLRWCDLDLDAGRLSVRQALVSVAYEMQISDVKTGASQRTIDLDPKTVEVMRRWSATRLAEKGGIAISPDDLVFVKENGAWPHPQTVSQLFDRTVAKTDLPRVALHDLRHTHATLLLKAGVPVKVVSERLGHTNVAFTMSCYQHVLPGMQAEAAAMFADIIDSGMRRHPPSQE